MNKEKLQADIAAFEKWQRTIDPEDDFSVIRVALLVSQGHGAPVK